MITKRDILEALGAEIHEDNFVTGMLVGIGVGAIVGGALAMLLSPRSGSEMRQLISERSADLYGRAKSRVGIGSARSGEGDAETPASEASR